MKPVAFTKDDITPTLKRIGSIMFTYPVTLTMFVLLPMIVMFAIKQADNVDHLSTSILLPLAYIMMLCTTSTLFLTPVLWNSMLFSDIFKVPVKGVIRGFNTTNMVKLRVLLVTSIPAIIIVLVLLIGYVSHYFGFSSTDEEPSTLAKTGTILADVVVSIIIGVYLAVGHVTDTVRFPTSGVMSEDSTTLYIRDGVGLNFTLFLIHAGVNTFLFFISSWMSPLVMMPMFIGANLFFIACWNHVYFSNIYPKVKVKQEDTVDDRDLATNIG